MAMRRQPYQLAEEVNASLLLQQTQDPSTPEHGSLNRSLPLGRTMLSFLKTFCGKPELSPRLYQLLSLS